MSDDLEVSAPAPAIPQPLTRAATADYMDRANWDPDKARAMVAQERLSNLGAHPVAVAQAVAPQMPQSASAAPAPSIPAAPVTPSQPGRVISLTPPAPKPVKRAAPKSKEIDLSAGFVPKSAVQAPAATGGDDIDLSAGFVPKEDESGILPMAERAGKTFAQGIGIPTSQEELAAAQPSLAEKIGGPAVTAGKMALNYGKNLYEQGKKSFGEAYEAGQNIGEGGPVAENIGKAGAAASDLVLKGILAPVGGPQVAKAGEEIAAGNQTPEAIGDIGAATVNALTGKDLLKGEVKKESSLPKTQTIADTELPLTVGQARELKSPGVGGKVLQPLEHMTQSLPGGKPLRELSQEQQAGARQILAGKAAKTGAEVSSAPDAIEQNLANAVEKTRQEGSAKYEAIANAAKDADLAPTTQAAVDILGDPETAKLLPPSARNALAKVGAAASERDAIARQIYGRAASTLDPDELANVIKAEKTAPEANFPSISGGAMRGVMDARSELADAAHGLKDPADRFRVGKALDSYDDAVNKSLDAHDKLNGTTLGQDLQDAKQLWTQKYAFDNFRKGMQQVMRGSPIGGPREINGQAFQRLVNKLDPLGKLSKQKSTLDRMFPGDPQSVKDIHDLADFMGKNQGKAGAGMGGNMARMRLLGLKESTLGLLTNAAGFSSLMARRGMAHAILQLFTAGKDTAKAVAAIGVLNHAVQASGDNADSDLPLNNERSADMPRSVDQATGNIAQDKTLPSPETTESTPSATAPNASIAPLTSSPNNNIDTAATTKNSATPAANENPNATATDVTTPEPPAQVPGSGTNEKRKGFDHPSREADKEAGWRAALKSHKTPAHLKSHLEKNLSQ